MSDLTEWLCTECGRKHEFTTDPDSQKVCNDCGAFLKRATEVPLTADSVLRELEEKLSEQHDSIQKDVAKDKLENKDYASGMAAGLNYAADELESLIGD